jgi:uncharacterized membrane protein YesL
VLRRDTSLSDFLDRAGTFVLANLLFVLLSIPLVTIPAAAAGLFATMTKWARGQQAEVFRDFFAGMRRHWRRATLVGVIDLLVGGLIVLNLSIFRLMNPSQIVVVLSQSATLFLALMAICANLYLFPLLVMFEDVPLRRLIETSIKLVFAFPFWSVVLLVLLGLPVLISLLVLPAAVLVLVTFSTVALSVSAVVWRVVKRYTVEDAAGDKTD